MILEEFLLTEEDCFGHWGKPRLQDPPNKKADKITIVPAWSKSHRVDSIVPETADNRYPPHNKSLLLEQD